MHNPLQRFTVPLLLALALCVTPIVALASVTDDVMVVVDWLQIFLTRRPITLWVLGITSRWATTR